MDEFIDELLREERACDVILPRIQVTVFKVNLVVQILDVPIHSRNAHALR